MLTRIEHDSMGEVAVPTEAYWGAQTQRSLTHFKIGEETMPRALIKAMAWIKMPQRSPIAPWAAWKRTRRR